MTPEQRFDRLERIAKLFVKAGLKERRRISEQNEKINILIHAQMKTEAIVRENEERFEKRFVKNEKRFRRTEQAIDRLVAAQEQTHQKLQSLIDVITGKRPGESLA